MENDESCYENYDPKVGGEQRELLAALKSSDCDGSI